MRGWISSRQEAGVASGWARSWKCFNISPPTYGVREWVEVLNVQILCIPVRHMHTNTRHLHMCAMPLHWPMYDSSLDCAPRRAYLGTLGCNICSNGVSLHDRMDFPAVSPRSRPNSPQRYDALCAGRLGSQPYTISKTQQVHILQ